MTHQEAVESLAAERYLLDEMPDDQRQVFEEHFFDCDECADDLRIAAALVRGAKAGFAGPAASGRVVPMQAARVAVGRPAWHRSLALPWAAAAALACIVTYQSLWVVPSLRRDLSPLALVPVTLRPESRGREATVSLHPGTGPVSLALEVNEAPQAGDVSYELKTVDGRRVVSGRVAAPRPGAPLLLLMPSWTLTGSMHYILSVNDPAASGRSLGEYRFAVSTE